MSRIIGTLEAVLPSHLQRDESQELRLALAQVAPAPYRASARAGEAEQAALAVIERLAQEASKKGADVLVLPEYFMTGVEHDAWRAVGERETPLGAHDSPIDDPQHFLHTISRIARSAGIDIVAGTAVEAGTHHHLQHRSDAAPSDAEPDEGKGKVYNTAYYVGRDGEVKGSYTKRNLWHPERAILSPASPITHPSPRTFNITTKRGRTVRVGMLICWDLGFPESFRELMEPPGKAGEPVRGPDVVFAPTCWYATDAGVRGQAWRNDGEAALLDSICQARAIENELVLAMCNVAGPTPTSSTPSETDEDPVEGVGRTCVCAPFLGCVQRVEDEKEALLLAAVDLRVLDDARETYKCRVDLAGLLGLDGLGG